MIPAPCAVAALLGRVRARLRPIAVSATELQSTDIVEVTVRVGSKPPLVKVELTPASR